jgi:ribosome-associated protein
LIELATVPGGKAAKKGPVLQPDELHKLILQSLDDDQAQEVVSIPLQGKSSIADYMVVASGRSSRQVASMAQKLAERIKKAGRNAHIEGLPSADLGADRCRRCRRAPVPARSAQLLQPRTDVGLRRRARGG